MGFDMSEVRDLATDLLSAEGKVRTAVQVSVKRGAMNVKRDAQRNIIGQVGRAHAKHYASSITFDVLPGGLAAEIGPTIGYRQAFLGKILEFGTATSAPHPHMVPAAEQEQGRLAEGVLVAAMDALGG